MLISIREWLQRPILTILKGIAMSQAELAGQIRAVTAKVEKIGTETAGLQAAIVKLEEALANSDSVSQEVKDAMSELQTKAQAVDDAVQDTPVDPVPPVDEPV